MIHLWQLLSRISFLKTSFCFLRAFKACVECEQDRTHDIVTNWCHLMVIQSGERWRTPRLSNCKSNALRSTYRLCESSAPSLMRGFERLTGRTCAILRDTDSNSSIRTSGTRGASTWFAWQVNPPFTGLNPTAVSIGRYLKCVKPQTREEHYTIHKWHCRAKHFYNL